MSEMVGRPKLSLLDRYSLRRKGRYAAYQCKPLRDPMVRITYCGKEIGLVSDTPVGHSEGFRLIEEHKNQKRVERYERAYLKAAGIKNRSTRSYIPTGNPIGRLLIEPRCSRKFGAYLLKPVGDGWEATYKGRTISSGSYETVYRAMRERQMFWRKHRSPETIQNAVNGRLARKRTRIAVEDNRRNCYRRRVDGAGNYYAEYHKRIVVVASTPEECEAGIDEHWGFVLPIRSLAT